MLLAFLEHKSYICYILLKDIRYEKDLLERCKKKNR